ncbi:hypothetical protein X801_10021 [Opisthorchis viverrini]|uniref:Mediator of RNA polymerase II transcription subunit 18 n=1 Tax=Opisthorchis viverrini TaxID=6198 RepID=A0A1S8WID5_OPIVI|nr:hypothetical protein X801_10021 [Opisthorchis viverrini]
MDKQQPVLSSRNQARITPGAVVCSECELCGEVVIGAGTIVHPKARIVAEAGLIHIGAFNLIEEQVEIINHTPDTVLKIGDHNVFEVGARCEAMEIGDNNVFEAKSCVGPHMRITNGCVIGAMCSLMSDETLPECTVIYGEQVSFRTLFHNDSVTCYLLSPPPTQVSRRSCLEVPVTGPLVCFLQELGFEPEFTYVAEGLIFIRGRVKVCVYTVNEVVQFESPVPPMPGTDGISGQDSYPKEWRRVCPNSWLVEISAVGSPADESLQDEVAEFADLLFPVIVPGKLDNSLFMRK